MTTKHNKLIAAYGSDLCGQNLAFLRDRIRSGYSILALDAKAMHFSATEGIPYCLIEDWFEKGEMRHLAVESLRVERSWFESARTLFTHEGICWPLFDHQAMFWFWRDVLLATVLMERFKKGGGMDLVCLTPAGKEATVFYDKTETWKSIFRNFHEKIDERPFLFPKCLSLSQETFNRKDRKSEMLYARDASVIKTKKVRMASSGTVFLALNPHESDRFTCIVDQLREPFKQALKVIILSNDLRTAGNLEQEWMIPVQCLPEIVNTDVSLQLKFWRGLEKLIKKPAHNDPIFELPLKNLKFHFEYYCLNRWPSLAAQLRQWITIWKEERPRAVIVSQLTDAEAQLPAEAARRLGIETFAIPHGGFYLGDEVQVSKHNLYSFKTHKYHLMQGGLAAKRICACKGIVAQNEYRTMSVENAGDRHDPGKWNVLVLSSMTTIDGVLMPLVSPRSQVDAFRTLNHPPPEIAARLNIRFKVHPGWPDMDALEMAGIDMGKTVLPKETNLHDMLPLYDLIVDLNVGSGTAAIHALRHNKPVLFFWPADINFGHWYEQILLKAGNRIRNPKVLWTTISRFFMDHDFNMKLRNKAARFTEKYLNDDAYPDLSALIRMHTKEGAETGVFGKKMNVIHRDSGPSESNLFVNIDADPDFYYGEIPKEHLEWIIDQNKNVHNIDLVTHEYCNQAKNDYFREYALDNRRGLALRLLGDIKGKRILDYGCGLGTLGMTAAYQGAAVDFVDSCIPRLQFARARAREKSFEEATFHACRSWKSLPFPEESFDFILLNGILEWIPLTEGADFHTALDTQLQFLTRMSALLKKSGLIFLAMENRFALRYYLGYPEDHTEIPYLSIMPRLDANRLHRQTKGSDFVTWTWSYQDYHNHLPRTGLMLDKLYGLFPDYRFPRSITSLEDREGLRTGIMADNDGVPDEVKARSVNYFFEMDMLKYVVYSYGAVIRRKR